MRVNAITKTHAEADAFQQALNSGATSKYAQIFVDRDLCLACGQNGGVASMAKQLGIETLEINTPGNRMILNLKAVP